MNPLLSCSPKFWPFPKSNAVGPTPLATGVTSPLASNALGLSNRENMWGWDHKRCGWVKQMHGTGTAPHGPSRVGMGLGGGSPVRGVTVTN